MIFTVQLAELDAGSLALTGEVPLAELDVELHDELMHVTHPLIYDITVTLANEFLTAEGRLATTIDCECSRCLKPFEHSLVLEDWRLELPLTGEDAPPIKDDAVDLTPWVREDIFLALPQHPLCVSGCPGLPNPESSPTETASEAEPAPSIWAALDSRKTH